MIGNREAAAVMMIENLDLDLENQLFDPMKEAEEITFRESVS